MPVGFFQQMRALRNKQSNHSLMMALEPDICVLNLATNDGRSPTASAVRKINDTNLVVSRNGFEHFIRKIFNHSVLILQALYLISFRIGVLRT